MISQEFIDLLRCPEKRLPLRLADQALLERLNFEVASGRLKNRAGDVISEPFAAGLVREDGAVFYPIIDDIPILLVDEGIEIGPAGTAAERKT